MTNQLSTEVNQTVNLPLLPETFSEESLNKLYKQVEDEVKNEVADVETVEGRKRIKSLAAKISKSKTAIDTPIRDYLRIIKAQPKVLEKSARESKLRFESLREGVLEPLLIAQKYQDNLLDWLNCIPKYCSEPEITSEQLKGWLEEIKKPDYDTVVWSELRKKFDVAIEAATTSATVTLERVTQQEKQAAELEDLRQKQAEAEQKEKDRVIAEEAAAAATKKAEDKAKKDREDIERRAVESKQREEEAQQATIKAKRDAEIAEENLIKQQEQSKKDAEQEKIKAKEREEAAVLLAQKNEQKRIANEAAETERLAAERAADKEHRIKINRAALCALVAGGISEEDAKTVITLIAKKQVPAIEIKY